MSTHYGMSALSITDHTCVSQYHLTHARTTDVRSRDLISLLHVINYQIKCLNAKCLCDFTSAVKH